MCRYKEFDFLVKFQNGVQTMDYLDCLDNSSRDTCEGEVEYRMALSSTGKSFLRCDKHWEKRLEEQDRINERYPVNAPADFDPAYAGERWDDDY